MVSHIWASYCKKMEPALVFWDTVVPNKLLYHTDDDAAGLSACRIVQYLGSMRQTCGFHGNILSEKRGGGGLEPKNA